MTLGHYIKITSWPISTILTAGRQHGELALDANKSCCEYFGFGPPIAFLVIIFSCVNHLLAMEHHQGSFLVITFLCVKDLKVLEHHQATLIIRFLTYPLSLLLSENTQLYLYLTTAIFLHGEHYKLHNRGYGFGSQLPRTYMNGISNLFQYLIFYWKNLLCVLIIILAFCIDICIK